MQVLVLVERRAVLGDGGTGEGQTDCRDGRDEQVRSGMALPPKGISSEMKRAEDPAPGKPAGDGSRRRGRAVTSLSWRVLLQ